MRALLPLKDFVSAKQRLGGLLAPSERRGLFQAMVEDLLQTLREHPDLDGTLLVSDDPAAKLLARHYGAEWLSEATLGARGLNPVVTAAVAWLAERGEDDVLVVHGDLPLLSAAEVSELVAVHRRHAPPALTIAPDRHRRGSNCLLASPATALRFAYGPDSLSAHCAEAERLGAALNVVELPGAGCDIDHPADLLACIRQGEATAPRTREYLRRAGIDARLQLMAGGEANSDAACTDTSFEQALDTSLEQDLNASFDR